MGMYTELVLGIEVENNPKVIQTLKYMLNKTEYHPEWEHELFKTDRWEYMLICDSYYFDGQTDSKLFEDNLNPNTPMYFLNVRCNLKNYNDEIEKFLDWLSPYIKTYGLLGYKRYEECEEPTLIYRTNGKIEYQKIEVSNQ